MESYLILFQLLKEHYVKGSFEVLTQRIACFNFLKQTAESLHLSSPQSVMFYDMGSGSTTATIVTYQTVKSKELGTQPQLQIRGVG